MDEIPPPDLSFPPVVVLVEPQLGENIGMVARAMGNCGLAELRLVNPRDGWPNRKAQATAAGGEPVIAAAKLFADAPSAVADLQRVYAVTARERDMAKPVVTPRQAATEIRADRGASRMGLMFGREAKGLTNDEVALADAILMIPVNPSCRSLNLAQAVFATAHEWLVAGDATPPVREVLCGDGVPATKEELNGLIDHLERELVESGFLTIEGKRAVMVRNLKNLFQRAQLTDREVRTLRGIIVSLRGKKA